MHIGDPGQIDCQDCGKVKVAFPYTHCLACVTALEPKHAHQTRTERLYELLDRADRDMQPMLRELIEIVIEINEER